MPKVNVYLPDELAEAVKAAELPVSAICQRALEQSVKRVSAIRAMVLDDLDEDMAARFTQVTERMRAVIGLGIKRARSENASAVSTGHLLQGLLAEGGNLALHVLRAMDIEPERLVREVERGQGAGTSLRFGADAANALELSVVEALTLGHNYVGCEHLLLGLLAEPDGDGGRALRAAGVELRATRGAVVAALAGYVHLRAQGAATEEAGVIAQAVRKEIQPLVDRVGRLEERVGLGGG